MYSSLCEPGGISKLTYSERLLVDKIEPYHEAHETLITSLKGRLDLSRDLAQNQTSLISGLRADLTALGKEKTKAISELTVKLEEVSKANAIALEQLSTRVGAIEADKDKVVNDLRQQLLVAQTSQPTPVSVAPSEELTTAMGMLTTRVEELENLPKDPHALVERVTAIEDSG